jgi:hypothetical protein
MTLPTATFIAIIPGAVIGSLGSLLLFYIQKKRLQIIRKNPLLKLGSGNHGENI